MLAEEPLQRDILHGDVRGEEHVAAVHRTGQTYAYPPDLLLNDSLGQLRQNLRKTLRALKIQGDSFYLDNIARLVYQSGL